MQNRHKYTCNPNVHRHPYLQAHQDITPVKGRPYAGIYHNKGGLGQGVGLQGVEFEDPGGECEEGEDEEGGARAEDGVGCYCLFCDLWLVYDFGNMGV